MNAEKSSGPRIEVDIRDSEPDWAPYLPPKAPEGAPNVLLLCLGRHRLRHDGRLRRPGRDAEHAAHRRDGRSLLELPHDRALLADPLLAADRAQRDLQRDGDDRRVQLRLPRDLDPDPVRERVHLRGAGRARLQHLLRRQVAPDAGRGDDDGLLQGPLAAGPRLRTLLRLPRRRVQQLVSGPRPRQPPGRPARHPGGGLPPLQGPLRPGDRVHPRRQSRRPRQALLHVPGLAGRPRAAPRRRRVGRQVQGQVRPGLRGDPRGDPRPPERAGPAARGHRAVADQPPRRARADRPRRQTVARPGHGPALGLAERRRAAPLLPHGGGLRRLHLLHRRPARPGPRLPGGVGPARQHAGGRRLRQRRQRRGRAERHLQRVALLQRHRRLDRADAGPHRRARQPRLLQPLQHRLGLGLRHAVPLLEALGRLRGRRRRHVPGLLAGEDRAAAGSARAVRPRGRHRADDLRAARHRAAGDDQGLPAEPDRGRELRRLDRRPRGRLEGDPVLRDAGSALDLPPGLAGLHGAPAAERLGRATRRTSGSSTTSRRTGRRRTTSRPRSRSGWRS